MEPSVGNFGILRLNTALYPNIATVNAAAWSETTRLAVGGHDGGDWGAMFECPRSETESSVQACSVTDILTSQGWEGVDLLKCDVEGAEREIFRDPTKPWLSQVETVAIELHDRMFDGCSAAVRACFPSERFAHDTSGECDVFSRRTRIAGVALESPEIRLIDANAPMYPIELANISNAIWAFVVFDTHACQLHPNAAGGGPASAIFQVRFGGQSAFVEWHHSGASQITGYPIRLQDNKRGTQPTVLEASRVLSKLEAFRWELRIPKLSGTYSVILETEMAPGSQRHDFAWARWIDPKFN